MRLDLIICPTCKLPLERAGSTLLCRACPTVCVIKDGVPSFAPSDNFYDSYSTEHCPFARSPKGWKGWTLRFLPFWSWREWRFWDSVIPLCERLLDFGCGRGREVFAERASETVGFDASLQFTRDCTQYYDLVAQGVLPRFPFPSRAFDVVASSHVFGHILPEHKDELISEIARLLRPGGLTVHIIETDSEHPMVSAAKRNPTVWKKQFVEQDGHVGLELAGQVIQRFEAQGFRLRVLRLVDAIIPSLQNYRKYLRHPDFGNLPGVRWLEWLDRWTCRYSIANIIYEVGMGIFHRTVEQWLGKPAHAQFIMVAFELANPKIARKDAANVST